MQPKGLDWPWVSAGGLVAEYMYLDCGMQWAVYLAGHVYGGRVLSEHWNACTCTFLVDVSLCDRCMH